MRKNRQAECTFRPDAVTHNIDKPAGSFIIVSGCGEAMVKVVYEGDDFKRMLRADKIALERIVSSGKTGIFEVKYKDATIKVEIKKRGMDLVVKRFRAI
jgi:hypothetical protein